MFNKRTVERIRKEYVPGTRVELLEMNDISAPPIGTCGTVVFVDAIATIHVEWDNGSTLGVAYGSDRVRKVSNAKGDSTCLIK